MGLREIVFWLFAVMLFYPPYFRGLFFQNEQQWTLLFAGGLFLLTWFWKLSRREVSFLSRPLDYFNLALVLAYVLSFFVAADQRLAVAEIVKVSLYFLVYWMASQLVREERDVRILLNVFYWSAVGVALAGIMTATEVIHINDGFVNGRIFSTLQYPNALAIYLLVLAIIGIYLWWKGGLAGRFLYAVGNYTLLAVFLGTNSRGAFLVFPLAFFLLFLGLPKGSRGPVAFHLAVSLVAAVLFNDKFLPNINAGRMDLVWLWFVVGALISIAGQLIYWYSSRVIPGFRLDDRRFRVAVMAGCLVLVVLGAVVLFWPQDVQVASKGLLPQNIVERLQRINLEQQAVQMRLYLYRDVFKLIREHPILGLGGGAWEATYRHYQSYMYSSTQVHNHFLQVWAETGTIGFIIFIGIWVSFLTTWLRLYRREEGDRALVWSMGTGAVALGAHSLMDFDLALSAVAMVLWGIFGFLRGLERIRNGEEKVISPKSFNRVKGKYMAGVVAASLVIILLSSTLLIGNAYARQAVEAFQLKNYRLSQQNFARAAMFDPFMATYLIDLAKTYHILGEREKALEIGEKSLAKSSYNARIYMEMANLYWQSGKKMDSIMMMEKAWEVFPFNQNTYDNLSRLYMLTGFNFLQNGELRQAEEYFRRTLEVPERLKDVMDNLSDREKELWVKWNREPLLQVSPLIKLNVGIANYFLNHWAEAEKLLEEAAQDDRFKGEAYLWLSIIKRKQGFVEQAEEMKKIAVERMPQLKRDYDRLRKLPVLQ
ncbi:O-antigen ligase family protein [Calderihabitans maritimus]|uniref:O-antigen ligase-related domain-containing protein n=1 Tax=Calderihabitans maritimus TaxID=1246530 RepID=A0A1Z5HXK5_9FIRM|nr:O-antigen ligase family protein [Calderihabitans maritimus]GAW94010.1 hypothetical protein PTH_2583 [Calderihabitans maritimus]